MSKAAITIGAGVAVVLAGAFLVHHGKSPMHSKTVDSPKSGMHMTIMPAKHHVKRTAKSGKKFIPAGHHK